jgi:hypothetical protein
MARLEQLIVDCEHPAALARFWAEVLDDFAIRPYDDAEIERLAVLGFTPETDPVVALPSGADRAAEVDRLIALGATVREDVPAHTWMRDPEGNDFCVTDG